MAVSLGTYSAQRHGESRRTSLLDVSNDLIRSLAEGRQRKQRLSTSWEKGSEASDRRYYSYQLAMPIDELESSDSNLQEAVTPALVPAVQVRRASRLLNSDPEAEQVPHSAGAAVNKRRNVYVCGQRMVVKQGAKPIGSIKTRSWLSLRRARLTDFAVILALGGLVLAVIDAELLAEAIFHEVSEPDWEFFWLQVSSYEKWMDSGWFLPAGTTLLNWSPLLAVPFQSNFLPQKITFKKLFCFSGSLCLLGNTLNYHFHDRNLIGSNRMVPHN